MKTRKKKIMKMMLMIIMMGSLLEVVVARGKKNYGHSPIYFVKKHQVATRVVGDYRPKPLSTALGFGKRKDISASGMETINGHPQSVTLASPLNFTKRTTTYWFLLYLRKHPELSRSLTKFEFPNSKKINRLLMDPLLKLTDFILFF